MPKLAYRYGTLTPSPARTRVLLIASATARFIGVAILWVPTASAPAFDDGCLGVVTYFRVGILV